MSDPNPYAGIFILGTEPRRGPLGPPERLLASKKLIRVIRDARGEHPSEEAFADWLANYMEGYAAIFAHPSIDASESAESPGPECSLCGMLWPMCGHHHLSHWKPVKHSHDPEENA